MIEDLLSYLPAYWPVLVGATGLFMALVASAHAVMYKRDTRAVIGWVGLIWLAPLLGSVLYVLLGINRMRRLGGKVQGRLDESSGRLAPVLPHRSRERGTRARWPEEFDPLVRLMARVTHHALLPGNRVHPLVNGDAAYPAMLEAIRSATASISLSTYIFDTGPVGRRFAEALGDAAKRGVEVRVLIDDVGARYSHPSPFRLLRRHGIVPRPFLPTRVPRFLHHANLRNHRKLLCVDGRTGFTGGMNLREGAVDGGTGRRLQDLHFRMEGPIVAHLQEAFAVDWHFSTGEALRGERWYPELAPAGDVWARGVPGGPDEDYGKLRHALLGALSVARRRIDIVTPYFLPDSALVSALAVAALRGVQVRIVLPAKNNIAVIHWASMALLWQVLVPGCRVWQSPPPFDHTKLFLVDDVWALVGSSNWDPRSLRLNFEFNVECYGRDLHLELAGLVERKIARARELNLKDVDSRPVPVRLRDGIARLFSPYL